MNSDGSLLIMCRRNTKLIGVGETKNGNHFNGIKSVSFISESKKVI